MARPRKQHFISLSISRAALEARLRRDPDHLDRDQIAAELGPLLKELVIERGMTVKGVVDLLIEAHLAKGIQVQR